MLRRSSGRDAWDRAGTGGLRDRGPSAQAGHPPPHGCDIEIEVAGTRKPLKLTTYVNRGSTPLVRKKAEYEQTLQRLRRGGLTEQTTGAHAGWYVAYDAIAPSDVAATPQAALWASLDIRLMAIAGSGTLDTLVS